MCEKATVISTTCYEMIYSIASPNLLVEYKLLLCILYTYPGIEVDLIAIADTPDDLPVLKPPYYYLTTSITLFCHVYDATGPVSYSWSRTSASNFTSDSTSLFNRNTFLTLADAGEYTCHVNDSVGNTGQDTLEIKFNGEWSNCILDIRLCRCLAHAAVISCKNSAQYCTTYGWNADVNAHVQKRDRQICIHTYPPSTQIMSLTLRYSAIM